MIKGEPDILDSINKLKEHPGALEAPGQQLPALLRHRPLQHRRTHTKLRDSRYNRTCVFCIYYSFISGQLKPAGSGCRLGLEFEKHAELLQRSVANKPPPQVYPVRDSYHSFNLGSRSAVVVEGEYVMNRVAEALLQFAPLAVPVACIANSTSSCAEWPLRISKLIEVVSSAAPHTALKQVVREEEALVAEVPACNRPLHKPLRLSACCGGSEANGARGSVGRRIVS